MRAYLDHHGTTPMDPRVRSYLLSVLERNLGNPSSIHREGRVARAVLEDARASVAEALGASPRELAFTSGGTEAVHLAIRGVGEGHEVHAVYADPCGHPALSAACASLAKRRGIPLKPLPIHDGGAPDLARLEAQLAEEQGPVLVAVSVVQHETGAIAPIRELVVLTRKYRSVCVGDSVQAIGKIPVDLGTTGLAAATISAHKFGGPTGVGAVWLSAEARVRTESGGGLQERGLRAGTENVAGIAALGFAVGFLQERLSQQKRVEALRARVENAVLALGDVCVNGAERPRVATAAHLSVRGVRGEEMVASLDLDGVAVSSGPACSSGRPGPSSSLLAMYPEEPWRASSALRVTLSTNTTEEEIAFFEAILPGIVRRIRAAQ